MEVSESWCILTILNFCQCLQMCKIRQGCNKWFWGCRTQPRCPYLDVRFHDWWNRPCICPFKSGLQTSNITWIQPGQEHSIQHPNFAVSCTSCHSKLGTHIQLLVYKRQCQHIQMRKIILFNLKKNFVAGAQHQIVVSISVIKIKLGARPLQSQSWFEESLCKFEEECRVGLNLSTTFCSNSFSHQNKTCC